MFVFKNVRRRLFRECQYHSNSIRLSIEQLKSTALSCFRTENGEKMNNRLIVANIFILFSVLICEAHRTYRLPAIALTIYEMRKVLRGFIGPANHC